MTTGASKIVSRVAIGAAVCGVAMLGNLRSQASEVPLQSSVVRAVVPVAPVGSRFSSESEAFGAFASADTDADGGAVGNVDSSDETDDAGVVPAIYAWDPDVRFVYFRHVSKWM